MKANNPISAKQRFKEIGIDYLVILAYLAVLAVVNVGIYFLIFRGIPAFTPMQSHMLSFFTSVLPIVLWFSYLDWKKPHGTFGKRFARLHVSYTDVSYWRSLVRNIVKFLPWQMAHIGVIEGVYTEYTSIWSHVFSYAGILLLAILIGMIFLRKDKRHFGDMLAGTQVVPSEASRRAA